MSTARRAGVVRVSTFHARPGGLDGLLGATRQNAQAARRAAGCLSADVCSDPDAADVVHVISRWASVADLEAFLGWHQRVAHAAVSAHVAGPPASVHYPVAAGTSSSGS